MLGVLGLVIVSAHGCDGGRRKRPGEIEASGRVTKGGAPLPLDPELAASGAASVPVTFFRLLDDGGVGGSQSVIAAPDGTFKMSLPGVGRYRVAVEHFNGGPEDLLRGRFGSQNSPIVIEVDENRREIGIELDAVPTKSRL